MCVWDVSEFVCGLGTIVSFFATYLNRWTLGAGARNLDAAIIDAGGLQGGEQVLDGPDGVAVLVQRGTERALPREIDRRRNRPRTAHEVPPCAGGFRRYLDGGCDARMQGLSSYLDAVG